MSTKKTKQEVIKPATAEEKQQIWDYRDEFVLVKIHKASSQLHMYEDCLSLHDQETCHKPTAVYPIGFKELCSNCLFRWREGDDGTQD